jgi:mannitol/fructose-specific phosphotransferase system IIA component (Ntr-type)
MFELLCARSEQGIAFDDAHNSIKAIFVLAGSRDTRTLHLKTLAAIAQVAMDESFESEWLGARKPERLREVLLLGKRRRTGR